MKTTLRICAILICAFGVTVAQDKPKPETVRLEPQSQQEVAEAQRLANEARAVLDAASARYDAAQQKVITAIFKAMADAGLKPKEWTIKQDQGGIYFEKLKPVETAKGVSPPPKPPTNPN